MLNKELSAPCTCGQAGHGNAHEPGCPRSNRLDLYAASSAEEGSLQNVQGSHNANAQYRKAVDNANRMNDKGEIPTPPKPTPDAMREADFRWLIEAPGTRYLAAQRLSMSDSFEWTGDHDKALAFRSREQATALMMAVRQIDRMYAGGSLFAFEATLGNAKAVEHGWFSALRSTPVSKP